MKYSLRKAEREFRARYVVRVLRAAKMNVIHAAKIAGVHRSFIYDLMAEAGYKSRKPSPREVYRVKPYREEFENFTRRFFVRALAASDHSPAKAARRLGMTRVNVYRVAARLGVGLRRLRDKNEGNAAWLALGREGEPAPQDSKADAPAPP